MKVYALVLLCTAAAMAGKPAVPSHLTLFMNTLANQQQPETRIINGESVQANAAPYIVSISGSTLVYVHICAGTIIDKQWVLTAAHCLDEINALSGTVVGMPVYAGLTNRSAVDAAQRHIISFAFSHKNFNGKIGTDDIALLRVATAFSFSAQVQQAVLPYWLENVAGENSALYGWGIDAPQSVQYVKDLRVSHATVLSATECATLLPKEAAISGKQICAISSACYGDGGSPLVIERKGSNAEIAGITSWGYMPCDYNKRPTVYTAVSQYIDWITQVQWAYNTLYGKRK